MSPLEGDSTSQTVPGVLGTNASPLRGDGVFGDSTTGRGVVGRSNSDVAEGVGGFNIKPDVPSGPGVLGQSIQGPGVHGHSTSQAGVVGDSDNGDGVFGNSTTGGASGKGRGVVGVTNSGVAEGVGGFNTQPSPPSGPGVLGQSIQGPGVHGHSTNQAGVVGDSDNAGGVIGSSPKATGVTGIGFDYGVFATANERGVFGEGAVAGVHGSSNNVGVYGVGVASSNAPDPNITKTGVLGQGDEQGVTGLSNAGIGVNGGSVSGDAIRGVSQHGYGGDFSGGLAPLLLARHTTIGHPASDVHQSGEFFVDGNGSLWYCFSTGTPGSWKQLAP